MIFNKSFAAGVLLAATALFFYSCAGGKKAPTKSASNTDSLIMSKYVATNEPSPVASGTDSAEYSETATLYLTIADTGADYYALSRTMHEISKKTTQKIDTMNRYYNVRKNEIELSEKDDDEMYRGEYFPRRFPGETLSLEYYKTYEEHSTVKNIAIVAGIYETPNSADSMLSKIKPFAPNAFAVKASIYVGCMH